MRQFVLVFLLSLAAAGPGLVHAETGRVASVFSVSKSSNRNQIQYAVRLDSQCRPAGDSPVLAWWEMRERGSGEREPLTRREHRYYGIAGQPRVDLDADGGEVTFRLKAVKERPIRIESWREGDRCRARAVTTVGGAPTELHRAHAVLRFWGLSHIDIHGVRLTDGAPVVARYDP